MRDIASESAAEGFRGRLATKRMSAFSALASRLSAAGFEAVWGANRWEVAAYK